MATKTYCWTVYEDGDTGKWHLTNEQIDFLIYLQNNDFLRDDLEFDLCDEEDNYE